MMKLTILSIELARACSISTAPMRTGIRCCATLSRSQEPAFLANFPRRTVTMEACGSAHCWARQLPSRVRLIQSAVREGVR
jgi:hypothetical protein